MCSRYYINEEVAKEIGELTKQTQEEIQKERMGCDIHPTDFAPVLYEGKSTLHMAWKQWGFPGIKGKKQVIFNARSEGVMEKRMFRDSIQKRRAVIPVSYFYEWNPQKEKITFYREDMRVFFLAGFYKQFDGADHFVILTTEANESVADVHHRMPLILEKEELWGWVSEQERMESILLKRPALLKRKSAYKQQTFSWESLQ